MDDHTVSYDEHQRWLEKESAMMDAELIGFLDAKVFAAPRTGLYLSAPFQARYEKGFREGKAKEARQKLIEQLAKERRTV